MGSESVSDRRIAALLACASLLFFLLFNHGHFKGSDELAVFEMTRSIASEGTLAIPPLKHTEVGADGRRYSYFAPGQSVLALPLYALARVSESLLPHQWQAALGGLPIRKGVYRYGGELETAFACLYSPLMSALLVALFFRFQRRLGTTLRSAVLCSALLAGCTYVTLMSAYFLRHSSEAVTILGGLYFFFRWRQGGQLRHLWMGSALASATLLIRLPALVAGPALAGYLAWALWQRLWTPGGASGAEGSGRFRVLGPVLAAMLVPLLVTLLLHAGVNTLKWGSALGSPMVGQYSRMGNPIYIGLYGFLLSPGSSIFVYSPLLLLAPAALRTLLRSHRAEALTLIALSLSFLLFFAKFDGWEGLWSAPGPRYLFILVPALLLPLGLWLDQTPGWSKWAWVVPLAALGSYVQVISLVVKWGSVPGLVGWLDFEPDWGFLFIPEHSPVVEMSRLFFGDGPRDLWLGYLWNGWEGFPGQPGAVLVLLGIWGLAFAGIVAALGRELRRVDA